MKTAPKGLFTVFYLVDLGFIAYWVITYFHLLPYELLYNDYTNPILVDWNWSFFPIDMMISLSGLVSIRLHQKKLQQWKFFAFSSLLLTVCSGLMANSFWSYRLDFNLTWWIPNLFLLLYPLFYVRKMSELMK